MLDAFAEGWRPNVGDKLIGIVIGIESRTTEFGEYPILTIRTDEGDDFAFHAYHTVAKREIEKLQPRVGDRIGIAYHGPHPTRGYERYRIVIARDTGAGNIDGATVDNPPEPSEPRGSTDAISTGDIPADDIPF
jgi:hypothetical protein